MSDIDRVKSKVQRILTDKLGSVRVDRNGDLVVTNESAVTFVSVREGFNDGFVVNVVCPLIRDVKITNELCRWVATEGQNYKLGGCHLNPNDDEKTGWVFFEYSITADDLDESELMNAVMAVAFTSNDLDNELQDRFGGELFGRE